GKQRTGSTESGLAWTLTREGRIGLHAAGRAWGPSRVVPGGPPVEARHDRDVIHIGLPMPGMAGPSRDQRPPMQGRRIAFAADPAESEWIEAVREQAIEFVGADVDFRTGDTRAAVEGKRRQAEKG